MTEAEWLSSDDPEVMLKCISGKASDRKVRLFICATCRMVWTALDTPPFRDCVEAGERYIDGLLGEEEIGRLRRDLFLRFAELAPAARNAVLPAIELGTPLYSNRYVADLWCDLALRAAVERGQRRLPPDIKQRALRALADLFRDVFATPFRPVSLDPAWLTADVVRLAHAAYDERQLPSGELDPQRLQILADALEDAGCANADMLGHLRGDGVHMRGCWVVDMLTGRE